MSTQHQLDQDFYEKFGTEWSSTDRRQFERIVTSYKVSDLCALMEGIRPKRILDFGCGLGDALDMLSKHFQITEAIGIDISSTMIAFVRKEYPEYTFIHGSIEKLKNIRVDLITFFDVLEHIEDVPAVLEVAKNRALTTRHQNSVGKNPTCFSSKQPSLEREKKPPSATSKIWEP